MTDTLKMSNCLIRSEQVHLIFALCALILANEYNSDILQILKYIELKLLKPNSCY